jgi:hypothetical protein
LRGIPRIRRVLFAPHLAKERIPMTTHRRRLLLASPVLLLAATGLGLAPTTCSGFAAHLSGDQEVPPVDSKAQAQALLVYVVPPALPPGASAPTLPGPAPTVTTGPANMPHPIPVVPSLAFKLLISSTAPVADTGENGQLLGADIHCAAAGETGPVAVTLFDANGAGVLTPTQVQGTLTDDSIQQPNDCNIATLADLVDAMNAGNAYVEIRTNAHPDGEIRGQIRGVGPH